MSLSSLAHSKLYLVLWNLSVLLPFEMSFYSILYIVFLLKTVKVKDP